MTIQSEISRKDYSRLMTIHLLKTPYMIVILVLGLAFLVFHFGSPELGQFYLFVGLGFIGLPLLTFFTIGQSYDKNKHFNEKIEFTIDGDSLELVGQTFRSSFTWSQITKVRESDKFFSLYQGRVLLTVINKANNDQEAVIRLRHFLKDKGKM